MTVLEHYRRLRKNEGSRASYCHRAARDYALVDKLWDIAEERGQVRIKIVPDELCDYGDLAGDCFDVEYNKDSVPGGARAIIAQEKAFKRLIEHDGVWGYVAEYWKECDFCGCGTWEHADSCWGFVGDVYEEALYEGKYAALKEFGLID